MGEEITKESTRRANRIELSYEGHTAILSLKLHGREKLWLLTGWKEEAAPGGTEGVNPTRVYAQAASGIQPTEGAGAASNDNIASGPEKSKYSQPLPDPYDGKSATHEQLDRSLRHRLLLDLAAGREIDSALAERIFGSRAGTGRPTDTAEILAPGEEAPSWVERVFHSLAPIKRTDAETQKIYNRWISRLYVGREKANNEREDFVERFGSIHLDTGRAYERGEDPAESGKISSLFEAMYGEAKKRGIDVKHREFYLPLVWGNSKKEIIEAMSAKMKDVLEAETNAEKREDIQARLDEYKAMLESMTEEEINTALMLNPSFAKMRGFENYDEGIEYGLTPKYDTVEQLAAHYRSKLEEAVANRKFLSELQAAGKIKTVDEAPSTWEAIKTPFSSKGYMAPPELARTLNGLFRDEANLSTGEAAVRNAAGLSKMMQEIKLSAGIPNSPANFFVFGQMVKDLVALDPKTFRAAYASFFTPKTLEFFREHRPFMRMMAESGIDVSNRTGNWKSVYRTFGDIWRGFSEKSHGEHSRMRSTRASTSS